MTILDGKALLHHGQSLACRYAGRVGLDAAQDLGSEAVLRVVGSPAPDGRMEPWLERIFGNLLVDHWRRRKPAPLDVDDFPALSSDGSPEEAALAEERRQLVRRSLAQLPRELRRALLSRYWGGMTAESAADRLGVAPATVRTRVHRSLRRLRDMLSGLRALFPPLFVNLGAKASCLALVPVLAAAVVAVPFPSRPAVSLDVQPVAAQHSRRIAQVARPRSDTTQPQVAAPFTAAPDKPRARTQPKAAAQEPPAPATAPVKVIDFDRDDNVEGDRLDPDGVLIFVPAGVKYDSMIEVPTNFASSFQKMIEDRL
jgi:RNA polymerase sigma-70 factor (ECF subfamily)